jgi:hypothetical protein
VAAESYDPSTIKRILEADPSHSPDVELARFRALTPANRAIVADRLQAIDGYKRLSKPSREDADRAAARLGMKRANFYRLRTRAEKLGPIIGLTPGARAKPVPSAARDGLHPLAEEAIAKVLASTPDAPLVDFLVAVSRAFKGRRIKEPTEATVRRRLAVLRQPGARPDQEAWTPKRIFNRNILVDQCAVASKAHGVDANIAIVFIVDSDTRLILGCGQSGPDEQWSGLAAALKHAARSARDFVVGGYNVDPAPDVVRWVMTEEMRTDSDNWEPFKGWGDTDADLYGMGKRSRGQRLVNLLGPQFDTFTLMPRVLGEGLRRNSEIHKRPPPDLSSAIAEATARWNYRILETASGMAPTIIEAEQKARLEAWRQMQNDAAVRSAIASTVELLEPMLAYAPASTSGRSASARPVS